MYIRGFYKGAVRVSIRVLIRASIRASIRVPIRKGFYKGPTLDFMGLPPVAMQEAAGQLGPLAKDRERAQRARRGELKGNALVGDSTIRQAFLAFCVAEKT